jgi:hypothetical protein
MGRHGRILTSIWEDDEFKRLAAAEQRLYLFLLSQANVNHAGLLPVTLKRWASKAPDLTVATIEQQLAVLEEARFVVLDDESEELLIRTFIRNDGVWRQPNVMAAAVSAAGDISSLKLRRALLVEMERLPLEQLSDEPSAKGGPSVRAQIRAHVAQMRTVLNVPPDPGPAAETAPQKPIERGTEGFRSPSEPVAKGSGNPSGGVPTRAHARAYSPTPSPTPAPTPEDRAREAGQPAAASPAAPRPDGRTSIPDDFAVTDGMRRWAHRDGYADLIDIDHSTAQFLSHYRSTGDRRKSWPDAWQKWIRDDHKRAAERAQRGHQPPLLQAIPGGVPAAFAGARPSTTDQRVAQGLALAAQLRAEEQQAQEKHA